MTDALCQYRHLWDGSQPGWTLMHVDRVVWTVLVRFPDGGPRIEDVIALRKTFPAFGARPAVEVLREVRGMQTLMAASDLSNVEHRRAVERARDAGLVVESQSQQRGGFLPISPEGHALMIDNEALASRVVNQMRAAGVHVDEVHVD